MPQNRSRWLAPLAVLVAVSCMPPEAPPTVQHDPAPIATAPRDTIVAEQISQYIRCIFQDRDGNMWFGTTSDGVARYNGRSLEYFNASNGFGSDWVNAIAQDAHGDLWFGTRDGVVRFDGNRFIRYTTKDGLASDHIWSMLLDRAGGWWFGTYEGVSRFDGRTFSSFSIPPADLSAHPYYTDPKLIRAIVQDRNGRIWFATNGGGAYRYDPSARGKDGPALTRHTGADGLRSDFVQSILVDRDGLLWFGTRSGVVCMHDDHNFTSVPGALKGDNVGLLYQDRNGHIWIGLTAIGLCRSDGTTTTCYDEQDGAGIRVVFHVLEDDHGRLWIGTGAGLYRYVGGSFTNVTKADLMQMALR